MYKTRVALSVQYSWYEAIIFFQFILCQLLIFSVQPKQPVLHHNSIDISLKTPLRTENILASSRHVLGMRLVDKEGAGETKGKLAEPLTARLPR